MLVPLADPSMPGAFIFVDQLVDRRRMLVSNEVMAADILLGEYFYRTRRVRHGVVQNNMTYAAVFALGRDRKSTRLNSSHVAISYAVFCLTTEQKHTQRAP